MITEQQHLKNIELNKKEIKKIDNDLNFKIKLNSNNDLKKNKDLKTQYKEGLINLIEYKQKIKEGCLKMKKEFNKTAFKSEVLK